MKTLLLSDIFPPKTGGSGRWFWEIYSRLPRDQYLIAAGEDPRQLEFDRTHDLAIARLPLTMRQWGLRSWTGLSGYWGATADLKRLIRKHGVGMIHCGRVLPEGVMALALKWRLGVKYLAYVHGEDVSTARESREHAFLVRRVLAGAELLIANSKNTRRILCGEWQVPEQKVRVLYPGVDTSRFVPTLPNPQVREQLSWGPGPVILTVGRLQKRKGHDQMIRAMRQLRDEFPDVLYVAIGDGEERAELERIVAAEGVQANVQLVGETDDRRLIASYQQCDLFILPNRQVNEDIEGFGMVLLEAQACGKPVIAGASGGTSEAMHSPDTGRIAACETPEGIVPVVADLLRDRSLRQAMGQQGREWTVRNFDWSALSQQAGELFDSFHPQRA
jgi:phosphatidylinositol alpha-1,6-mannosyltransferase